MYLEQSKINVVIFKITFKKNYKLAIQNLQKKIKKNHTHLYKFSIEFMSF